MKHGFIKVACVTPEIKVADPIYNAAEVIRLAKEASDAKIIVFPELVLSGYTCQDLFLQDALIRACKDALLQVVEETADLNAVLFVGLPFEKDGKLYNVAAAVSGGSILALYPKKCLPNYAEFYEVRHFCPAGDEMEYVTVEDELIPFGTDILLKEVGTGLPLTIGCEICEDLWTIDPPSTRHAMAGANVIVNLSASNELVTKASYRKSLVASTSARLVSGYVYCSAGEGESTQDLVFGGHNIIAENGSVLKQSELFATGIVTADLDLTRLQYERRRMTTFPAADAYGYDVVEFALLEEETKLERFFAPMPFVPSDMTVRRERCEEILSIQALGLKKRLKHTGCKKAVIGLSGGLDSTLAALVIVRAFDSLGLDRKGIICVTMPCFGTTGRTYKNACDMAESIGCTLKEVDIKDAVTLHFRDIGHDINVQDVTYENGQARERTQVLMNIANQEGCFVVGTGDMSELALGWATYNGDHMSMYGVNAGVPKTLVRHLVRYYADTCNEEKLSAVLYDVLDTPVSPELLPPKEGEISQKTEDLVGPYELHDFFLYYMLRCGFTPDKVFRLALRAFEGNYDRETILKWEKTFYRRFFAQQFKRSCLPDGPKVGSVAVSPRGDLRMPSDAMATVWNKMIEEME